MAIAVDVYGTIDPIIEVYNPMGTLFFEYPARNSPPEWSFRSDLELGIAGKYTIVISDRKGEPQDEDEVIAVSIQKKNNALAAPDIRGDTIIQASFAKLGQIHSYTFLGRTSWPGDWQ